MPSGLYSVAGEVIKVSIVLYRSEKQIGEEISGSGRIGDKENLIRQLVAEMIKAAH